MFDIRLRSLLVVGLLVAYTSKSKGLEYVVTDTLGGYNNPLNTTTNKLNFGDNPVPKTVYIYLKYSDTEANTINDVAGSGTARTPGLYSGSFQIGFTASTAAYVRQSSDITTGPSGSSLTWNTFTPSLPPSVSNARATMTQGVGGQGLPISNPGVGNFGYQLVGQVLISNGAIDYNGATVTVSYVSTSRWASVNKNGTAAFITAQPANFTFTVVPEASSIAMGVIGATTIFATAFHRHSKQRLARKQA